METVISKELNSITYHMDAEQDFWDTENGCDTNYYLYGVDENYTLDGVCGNDILNGGCGIDTVTITEEDSLQNFWNTENSYDTNDHLYVVDENYTLDGICGNDILNGGCGIDTVTITEEEDFLQNFWVTENSYDANDHLYGVEGNDTLFGDCGNDTLTRTEEEDSFFCQKVKKTVFPRTIHVSEDSQNLINLPDGTIPTEVFALATEYRQLAFLSELSEEQAERMEKILELAEEDELLSSLLIEADRSVFIKQDILDEDNICYFRKQQSNLYECIEKDRSIFF